jgi:L-cystine uptake protein TcyP (sodium:dicarboxylate symporter family)
MSRFTFQCIVGCIFYFAGLIITREIPCMYINKKFDSVSAYITGLQMLEMTLIKKVFIILQYDLLAFQHTYYIGELTFLNPHKNSRFVFKMYINGRFYFTIFIKFTALSPISFFQRGNSRWAPGLDCKADNSIE